MTESLTVEGKGWKGELLGAIQATRIVLTLEYVPVVRSAPDGGAAFHLYGPSKGNPTHLSSSINFSASIMLQALRPEPGTGPKRPPLASTTFRLLPRGRRCARRPLNKRQSPGAASKAGTFQLQGGWGGVGG